MDYKTASENIRVFVRTIARGMADENQGQTIDRLVINALQIAWGDAIRDQWNGFCEVNQELKVQVAVARVLMTEAGYTEGDPICGPPGVEPFICMFDGKKAVCYDYSMVNAMPLSAIFANKVADVMNAAAKVAAATKIGTV